MSWQAFQAVRDYSKVTDNTGRLIMFTIASYCNEHGNMDNAIITPSYQTLANGAACHKQTVKNWLKKLVKSGELSYTTEKIKGSNIKLMTRFTINLPMSDTCLEFDENIENEPQTKLDLLQRIEHLENELNAVFDLLKKVEENEEVSTSRVHCEYIHGCTHKDSKDNKDKQSPNDDAPPSSLDNNNLTIDDNSEKKEPLPIDAKHPAIKAIRHVQKSYPSKSVWDTYAKQLGENVNLDVLIYVSDLWNMSITNEGKPYNPTNINGKITWYLEAMRTNSPLEWKPKTKTNTGWTTKADTGWV